MPCQDRCTKRCQICSLHVRNVDSSASTPGSSSTPCLRFVPKSVMCLAGGCRTVGVRCTSSPRCLSHARSGAAWDLTACCGQRVRVTCLGEIDESAAVLRSGARVQCSTLGCLTGMAGADMAGTAAAADASRSTVAATAAVVVVIVAVIVAAAAVVGTTSCRRRNYGGGGCCHRRGDCCCCCSCGGCCHRCRH